MLGHLQLDLCFVLLSRRFNRGRSQLDKDSLLLLLEVRMFRGPKLPKTYRKLIVGASTVVKRDITPIDAPIHALVPIRPLQLHLPLPMEPILFWLPPCRTMFVGESTMLPWKKRKKLLMLSLVYFSINDASAVVQVPSAFFDIRCICWEA
jgi:hypothetical protein